MLDFIQQELQLHSSHDYTQQLQQVYTFKKLLADLARKLHQLEQDFATFKNPHRFHQAYPKVLAELERRTAFEQSISH